MFATDQKNNDNLKTKNQNFKKRQTFNCSNDQSVKLKFKLLVCTKILQVQNC